MTRRVRSIALALPFLIAAAAAGGPRAAAPAASSPAAPATAPAAPAPSPAATPGVEALRVDVETLAVDRRGTWSVGTDEADIFPGRTGVLTKKATLQSRLDEKHRETIELVVRITPERGAGGACVLRLGTAARRVGATGTARAAGDADRKTVSVTVRPDEEKLVEVFASSATNARLALKIRCGDALPVADDAPSFVDFHVSLSRGVDDGSLEPLKDNLLRAALGGEASNSFSVNVPLAEDKVAGKRYRKEALEILLDPQLVSGRSLQLRVLVRGELATVSADAAPVAHPIDRDEVFIMKTGENRSVDIEVVSGGETEGWARVHYRFDVYARF